MNALRTYHAETATSWTLDLCCGWALTQHVSHKLTDCIGSYVKRTCVALGSGVLWPSFCPRPW